MIKQLLSISVIILLASCGGKMSKTDKGGDKKKQEVEVQNIKEEQVVYFDYDKSSLTDAAKKILSSETVVWLKKDTKSKVLITGHCDERGTDAYNMALGKRRAQAARAFLIKQGISRSRISINSRGKSEPVDAGHDESAWAKNRRAVTVSKL